VTDDPRGPSRVDARALLIVALLALAVSAPSLLNGFAYDDNWIIVRNGRIHELARWRDWFQTSYWPTFEATLYRPLTTAGYALQWAIGGGSPWVFHLVNVILAVLGAVAFTWVASLLLPARAAVIAGAAFAVHPVHVEAIANCVGQAELSAGLVMMLALGVYIRERQRGIIPREKRLLIAGLYFIGVLLKEHAFVLPAWFAVAELTLFRDKGPLFRRVRALAPLVAMLTVVAAFGLMLRYDVLGAIGGDIAHPSLQKLNMWQRTLVMLGVVPDFARLLLWPAHLYADYSPQHIFISTSPHLSQLNGLVIILGAVVLTVAAWRRSATAAFGLLMAFIVWLPTANILFPSGVVLAERTLYLPSAGVLLAAGVLVAWCDANLPRRTLNLAGAALGALIVAAQARFISRDLVWKSSEVVFHTMLREQPLSFRAHYAWGGVLFERHDLRGGELEWRAAIKLMPNYHHLYQELAFWYQAGGFCNAAIPMFKKALLLGGPLPNSLWGLTKCQMELHKYNDARKTAVIGRVAGRDPAWFSIQIATADSALAAADSVKR
jgi:hypothetical protein